MILNYAAQIFPRLIKHKLARRGLIKPPHPLMLNFSVTNKCQSHCLTCNIWQLYDKNPEKEKHELNLSEIEKVFSTMQSVFLLNICGGEPTLREDLPDICELACKYIKPKVIHFPTNCLSPEKVEKVVRGILSKIPTKVHLTVKLSLDDIGEKHDKIRGTPGNFEKLLDTYKRLVKVREEFSNFYLDAGTTVSTMNIDSLREIRDYANKNFELDNFLFEIADTRAELFNFKKDEGEEIKSDFKDTVENLKVTPDGWSYSQITDYLCDEIIKDMKTRRPLSKITQALRIVYYKRAAKVMTRKKRIVNCYAGLSNAHLNPWGDLWVCNVQAFRHSMGNVRDFDLNFNKLWHSKNANEVREWVNQKHCYCPLVGQAFLDTVMSPIELAKVMWYYFKS